MSFMKIIDHNWVEGELHFTAQFGNDDHQTTLSIPFGIIKKDEPFATAKYILDEIVGTRSNDGYHLWARKLSPNIIEPSEDWSDASTSTTLSASIVQRRNHHVTTTGES